MAQPAPASVVNEPLLAERLEQVAAAIPDAGDLLDAFAAFVRTAEDDELVRINPVRFARALRVPGRRGGRVLPPRAEARVADDGVAVRLPRLRRDRRAPAVAHLRHGSLLLPGLQRGSRHRPERLRRGHVQRLPEFRRSSYHDPWSLDARGALLQLPLHAERRRGRWLAASRPPPRAAPSRARTWSRARRRRSRSTAEPRYLWLTNGPALIVGDDRTSESALVRVRVHGRAQRGVRGGDRRRPGRDRVHECDRRAVRAHDHQPPGSTTSVTMQPFLSGAELLSNQTFLDLFASETIVAGEGLAVKRLALLFTDLQGVDRALRPDRRHEGVRPRAAALRLPAGEHLAQLGRAREDDRRCGDGELRRSARRPAGGAGHAARRSPGSTPTQAAS